MIHRQKLEQQQTTEEDHDAFINQQNRNTQTGNNYQYYAVTIFVIIISFVLLIEVFKTQNQDEKNGRFYRQELLSYELIDFWKRTPQQMKEEQSEAGAKIIQKGQHQISRKELGHHSWQLLHMMTGSFPDEIPEHLAKKFNIFLISFGQMYPCKLCANHFMGHLKKKGLFRGKTKLQLMTYLCEVHNMVNLSLGKKQHDCTNVLEEWNTCGCSGPA